MGYVEVAKVKQNELDVCDTCNQQGLKTSGKYGYDNYGEPIIFTCFNCVEKIKRNEMR
jgi:hypothetical protein